MKKLKNFIKRNGYPLLFTAGLFGMTFGIISGALTISNRIRYGPNFFKRSEKISCGKVEEASKKKGKVYALLVNGRDNNNHDILAKRDFHKNVTEVHNTLKNARITDEQIYILESLETIISEAKDTGQINIHENLSYATLKNLDFAINDINKKITPNDIFILYVTNHGTRVNGESVMCLANGYMFESDLENLLSKLHPNYSLMVFTQCYSGGFAKRFGKGRNISIATCEPNKESYNTGEEPIARYFFPALFGNGKEKKEADKNKDGNVSVDEAFDYVTVKDAHSDWKHTVFLGNPHNTYQLRYGIDPKTITFYQDSTEYMTVKDSCADLKQKVNSAIPPDAHQDVYIGSLSTTNNTTFKLTENIEMITQTGDSDIK